jgi:tRNA(fMet)-specific endonuclease VapC
MRYLLDTSIVSVPVSQTPDPVIVRRLQERGSECAIAAPVWHELVYGVRRLPTGKRRTALESYLRDAVQAVFPVLPYDELAARWYGEESARLEAAGQTVPYVDGEIAAIAHANALILVTANTRHFSRFRDLTVENWSRRASPR